MPSLTSFVLIGLALAGSVSAEDCSTEALMKLASSTNLAGCTADTGVSVSTISTLTMDQVMAVCQSSSCMGLMDDVASANLGDCTIPGSNVSVQSDILDQVWSMCSGSGTMGSMAAGSSSSSNGGTNVGDESGTSSSSSDKATGGSSSTSGAGNTAGTVTIGFASDVVAVAMILM
uniref:Elicitin n=1 Tax=Phytophthora infestans TaxID=4787 RepID=Q2N0E3_PHYIN|nr:elicitin-like protein INL3a [Phytophthora infestans]